MIFGKAVLYHWREKILRLEINALDQTILKSQTICKSLSLLIQFCYRDRQALDATMATVNVTFQAPDTLLAVDVESIGVDFRKRDYVF